MKMTRRSLALLIAAVAMPVSAQTIYKCIDANGGTLISNSRVDKNCKAVVSGPESSMPPPPPRAKPVGASANPSPAGFPRVQEDTQKARDTDRRHILDQELAGEQRNLEQARKDLGEQEALRAVRRNAWHLIVIASRSTSATFRRSRKSWATSGSY
jgi:hypothetical protein